MDKEHTCCFTGHRKLPKDRLENIVIRLNREIDTLISQGVTTFISGGALGFDQIAASLIIAKKEMGKNIKLIFALPCKNQTNCWNSKQKRLYNSLLLQADEVIYTSEHYSDDCMKKRNHFMVDSSAYCICAKLYPNSGTEQTVKYAIERGLKVINVAKPDFPLYILKL